MYPGQGVVCCLQQQQELSRDGSTVLSSPAKHHGSTVKLWQEPPAREHDGTNEESENK